MKPGHPDVIDPFYAIARDVRSDSGFFRHWEVAGARGDDCDGARPFWKR